MAAPQSPRTGKAGAKQAPLIIAPGDAGILKHGWLVKQGGSYKSLKKRYFYLYGRNNLRNVVITYHKKPNEAAIDELPVDGAFVELPAPGTVLNFRPKNNPRLYPFKSTTDSAVELQEWYNAIIEHTFRLEEVLFPGTSATVSTMHVFSTLQDRFGCKPGHIRALFNKLNVDYSGASIQREAIAKWLRFMPPIRKENPNYNSDVPNANLDVLATSVCHNTLSHWTRLMHQPWFFMYKDNFSVYKFLQSKEVGAFVVRFGRFDDTFVLSVKGPIEILHYPIVSSPAGFGLPNSAVFPSIYGCMRNFVNSPLPAGISLLPFQVVDLVEAGEAAKKVEAPEPEPVYEAPRVVAAPSVLSQKMPQQQHQQGSGDEDMAPPPSLPSVEDLEPPPTLGTPGHGLSSISASGSVAPARLTTAYEVPTQTAASYPEPWKIPPALAKADGWKTAKHGLCRRILLQKGLKVKNQKEVDQLSHILRILSPDGPVHVAKCYALENQRLTTLFEANNSFLESKVKSYVSQAAPWAASDPTGQRAETNQVLDSFSGRCAWNKDKPLKVIPLVFYATEGQLQVVEAEGFDKSTENAEGPYGAGFYMTRSLEEARVRTNNGPFIIAFVTPGRVYPVIEPPVNPNAPAAAAKGSKGARSNVSSAQLLPSLFGKPVKDGYDAHFVRTCGSTKDEPGTGQLWSPTWTGSEWDHLVLFSIMQAVPRYLVYLD